MLKDENTKPTFGSIVRSSGNRNLKNPPEEDNTNIHSNKKPSHNMNYSNKRKVHRGNKQHTRDVLKRVDDNSTIKLSKQHEYLQRFDDSSKPSSKTQNEPKHGKSFSNDNSDVESTSSSNSSKFLKDYFQRKNMKHDISMVDMAEKRPSKVHPLESKNIINNQIDPIKQKPHKRRRETSGKSTNRPQHDSIMSELKLQPRYIETEEDEDFSRFLMECKKSICGDHVLVSANTSLIQSLLFVHTNPNMNTCDLL